jgi:capsule polysaccharide export protein KpsE/RkpR
MLQINDIERIAYITNNIPALQLCTELDDVQAELSDAESRIETLEARITDLESDNAVMLTQLEFGSDGTDLKTRLEKLEKMISRTVFNLRENGHLTKKQQLNLADFLEKF